tara:strand:+ start:140 stop:331 length:192 start_codon:yes stop_codon:yes gene_type:complete
MITRLAVTRGSPLYTWSFTEGLCRLGFGNKPEQGSDTTDATNVLRHIKTAGQPGLYVLCDFHP